MSEEERPTWVHTEFVELSSKAKTEDGWPDHKVVASINPVLDWIELTASHRHTGMMVRMPKADFAAWLKECQAELDKQAANPVDTSRK
jgi:hypothetical protein